MKAVRVKVNREPANVNLERCLGCGVCVPTCPMEAIELVPREEIVEWPDHLNYIQRLLAERKGFFKPVVNQKFDYCREACYKKITLVTDRLNWRAIRVYRKCGFKTTLASYELYMELKLKD
ncbi:MAG: hypothetical protein PWQ22_269 [Archaeoglobaceae archaeon]|nr:hypothetical protein [Archaeoglobaceae archaeon]